MQKNFVILRQTFVQTFFKIIKKQWKQTNF